MWSFRSSIEKADPHDLLTGIQGLKQKAGENLDFEALVEGLSVRMKLGPPIEASAETYSSLRGRLVMGSSDDPSRQPEFTEAITVLDDLWKQHNVPASSELLTAGAFSQDYRDQMMGRARMAIGEINTFLSDLGAEAYGIDFAKTEFEERIRQNPDFVFRILAIDQNEIQETAPLDHRARINTLNYSRKLLDEQLRTGLQNPADQKMAQVLLQLAREQLLGEYVSDAFSEAQRDRYIEQDPNTQATRINYSRLFFDKPELAGQLLLLDAHDNANLGKNVEQGLTYAKKLLVADPNDPQSQMAEGLLNAAAAFLRTQQTKTEAAAAKHNAAKDAATPESDVKNTRIVSWRDFGISAVVGIVANYGMTFWINNIPYSPSKIHIVEAAPWICGMAAVGTLGYLAAKNWAKRDKSGGSRRSKA